MSTSTNSSAVPNRTEALRLLGIATKLLENRDLTGSREFAVLAQETDPLLDGSDQILAISDVLLASDRNPSNLYSILGLSRSSNGESISPDLVKRNYRRLALLLHPDKNKYPFSDSAFKHVADAWAVLGDPAKKAKYDAENQRGSVFSPVELNPRSAQAQSHSSAQAQFQNNNKLPVRRSTRGSGAGPVGPDLAGHVPPPANHNSSGGGVEGGKRTRSFWTACPYCYVLYEYPSDYEECCLRCENCHRAFHATAVASLPPRVPGKEAYYCCWGFFPIGFSVAEESDKGKKSGGVSGSVFPSWMPPMFSTPAGAARAAGVAPAQTRTTSVNASAGVRSAPARAEDGVRVGTTGPTPTPRKRGRPRKNPL